MNNYFKVLRPGINSTFQDLGRFGLQHLGIVASGCMDQLTFCTSNKLVGNKISEGALEFAYQGPLIEHVGETALIAVSGKVNFNIIKKNDEIIKGKPNESFLISNGEKIDILSTINSVYGYFSIFGGFKIEEVKGSVSTLVKAKIGPNNGDKLKVGDMPQTAYVGGLTLKPIKGLSIQGLYKMYDDNYADWSPDAREYNGDDSNADRSQVWQAPAYNRLDLHASYKLPISNYDMSLTGHVFNALDALYVQDAVDNSKYNGFGDKLHLAHNAEVFLGTPRYANIGLTINF